MDSEAHVLRSRLNPVNNTDRSPQGASETAFTALRSCACYTLPEQGTAN